MSVAPYLVLIVFSAVGLILSVIGTPLAVVKNDATNACLSFYWYNTACDDSQNTLWYVELGDNSVICAGTLGLMGAGIAFTIATITTIAAAIVFSALYFPLRAWWIRVVTISLSFSSVVLSFVTVGIAIRLYTTSLCDAAAYSTSGWTWGPTYGLFITTGVVMGLGGFVHCILLACVSDDTVAAIDDAPKGESAP